MRSRSVLVYLDAQWIAGSQGEGGDAFVAVCPHVVVVHLVHPHGGLVQDTCRTRHDTRHSDPQHDPDVDSHTHTHTISQTHHEHMQTQTFNASNIIQGQQSDRES